MFSTKVPNPPRNLEVIPQNTTSIFLKWDVPEKSDDVTIQYDVSYNTQFWMESNLTQVDTTNVTLHNLRPGTTYEFSVSVFAGNRNSDAINQSGITGKWFCLTGV